MEDDAYGMAMPRADAADAVPQIHPVDTPCALHGAIVDREYSAIALSKGQNDGAGLHTRSLLRHHEFPACKVRAGFGQQNRELEGKDMLAV